MSCKPAAQLNSAARWRAGTSVRRLSGRHSARGVGLLDALIALALLAFGMLAMTQFQGRMVAQTTESQSRQIATQFATQHLSTVLVDGGVNAACYTLPQSGTCPNATAIANSTAWKNTVALALPAPVTTVASLSGDRMTVTITWLGKESGDVRTLEAVTDVR